MDSTTQTPLLNEAQAAEYLGIAKQTLAKWRSQGTVALPFVKIGTCIRYKPRDLEKFVERKTVKPTAGVHA